MIETVTLYLLITIIYLFLGFLADVCEGSLDSTPSKKPFLSGLVVIFWPFAVIVGGLKYVSTLIGKFSQWLASKI